VPNSKYIVFPQQSTYLTSPAESTSKLTEVTQGDKVVVVGTKVVVVGVKVVGVKVVGAKVVVGARVVVGTKVVVGTNVVVVGHILIFLITELLHSEFMFTNLIHCVLSGIVKLAVEPTFGKDTGEEPVNEL
jgi:hypothetical protein